MIAHGGDTRKLTNRPARRNSDVGETDLLVMRLFIPFQTVEKRAVPLHARIRFCGERVVSVRKKIVYRRGSEKSHLYFRGHVLAVRRHFAPKNVFPLRRRLYAADGHRAVRQSAADRLARCGKLAVREFEPYLGFAVRALAEPQV